MTPTAFELAELNVARAVAPVDDPAMHGFASLLEEINALAERSPGFVWRLADESGNATSYRPFEDPDVLINLSVWDSIEALHAFVYRSAHGELVRDGAHWFHRAAAPQIVLWWVPRGHRPSLDEALARLERLRREGPSAEAFDLRSRLPPPPEATSPAAP